MLKTGQHFSLHSGPSASTRFIHQVCLTSMNRLILWATRQCFLIQASLCSLMITLWVVLREIPSTTRLLVMKRTLLKFVSSISRQRRWSRCTSLIVRPMNNSQDLYGSYQVSSRHNSSQLLYVVLFFFGFLKEKFTLLGTFSLIFIMLTYFLHVVYLLPYF